MFSELKNRGVEDMLIAVCDGLKGLPEAITTTWERTMVQQCIVHLIRSSFRYAGRQHRDGIVKALKPIYTAPSEAAAKDRFREFAAEWGERYPAIVKLWKSSWASVCALPRIRRGGPPDNLHHERDRVDQHLLPPSRQSPRALPQRSRGFEMSLPRHPVS